MDLVMITLAIAGILLLIASAWMLNNFDRLVKASKNPNFSSVCNVDVASVQNGRNYAIFALIVSIIIFIVTGYLLFAQVKSKF